MAKTSTSAKKTVTVVQTGSPIGRRADQEATLKGLGLNKRHRQRTLEDTHSVRGMINKVKHLVQIASEGKRTHLRDMRWIKHDRPAARAGGRQMGLYTTIRSHT